MYPLAEWILQRDLEILAAQLAEEASKREEEAQRGAGGHEGRGRQLVGGRAGGRWGGQD